jgi:hypothetical protein
VFSNHFNFVALFAVLLHLGDGLLAMWGHSQEHERDAVYRVAVYAGHHHDEWANHTHDESADPEEHEHSLPGHDHCAACRHIAQAAAHQFAWIELPTIEKVAPLCCRLEIAEFSQPAHAYQSRGPPPIAL